MPVVAAALPGILLNVGVGIAVNAVVGLAVNAITSGGQGTQVGATPSGIRLEPRAGVDVPVSAILGWHPTPGTFWYQNSYGNDNEYLQLVYECGRTEHDAMTGLLMGGRPATLSGSNADPKGRVIDDLTVDGVPNGWIKYYTGAAGQEADPELVARANPPERWPATKTMTATAYAIVTLRFAEKAFPAGIPSWRFIWRGVKAYDRRKDSTQPGGSGPHRWGQPETYEWTANPAILQDNWRRGLWANGVRLLGLGVGEHACHHARIVAAANLCDEEVEYADTGRTLARYSFSGEISDNLDTIAVMRMFETSMAGFGTELGGAYAPLPAQAMMPVMTIYDHDRVAGSDVSERTRLDPTEVKTAYHGLCVSPEAGWLPKEYGLRTDLAVEAEEGGRRQGDLDLTFVAYPETAAMIAEVFRRRDRFQATEVAVFGPKTAKLEPGDVVTRNSAFFGTIRMMVWEIKELTAQTRRMTLRAWDNSIVPDADEGFMPVPVTPIPAPVPARPITVSAFLAVAAEQISGTTRVPAIRTTFTPVTDRTVERVIVKYWPTATPADVRYASSDEPASGVLVIENPVPETEYKLEATIVTNPPRTTTWSVQRTVATSALVVAAEVPPDSVTAAMMVLELRNRIGPIVDDIYARVAANEEALGDLAQVWMEDAVYQQSRLTGLSLRGKRTAASVTRLEEVVISPTGAFAQLTERVEVVYDNVSAGGFFRVTAEVSEEFGTTILSFGVKATNGEWTALAALQLLATATMDGADASILMLADRIGMLSTDGDFVSEPFKVEAINAVPSVVVTTLYFDNLFSTAEAAPGVPIIQMIGETGAERITVPD